MRAFLLQKEMHACVIAFIEPVILLFCEDIVKLQKSTVTLLDHTSSQKYGWDNWESCTLKGMGINLFGDKLV